MEWMFARENYFKCISAGSSIRLLTGIRRGGKSSLLRQAMDSLRSRGVDDSHIIYYDFENYVLPEIQTSTELRRRIESLLQKDGKFYIFLDEIQTISGWEKTLAAFQAKNEIEFFIASSGIKFKNLKQKKYFGENCTEIKISPLSYSEYCKTSGKVFVQSKSCGLLRRAIILKNSNHEIFDSYVKRGGFPGVLKCDETETAAELNNIYTSIMFHDVIVRQKIENSELLEKIIKYIFENIGGECSAGFLTKYFKEKNYTKNSSRIAAYIKALEEAFVIKRIRNLNLKTYSPNNAHSKYYIGDHALVYAVSNNNSFRLNDVLENILVNELERRGYEIYWGRHGTSIIKFVAAKEQNVVFIQTTDTLNDDDKSIRDKLTALINVPSPGDVVCQLKFFIFLNAAPELESEDGEIKRLSLPNFLLNEDY
jgi:predicted AAA+ superfamily ATPase